MYAKCSAQKCNRKVDQYIGTNLCSVCQEWCDKWQNVTDRPNPKFSGHLEVLYIYNSMANVYVYMDQNKIMRVIVGSML